MKKIILLFFLVSLNCFSWSDLTVKYMIVNAYKTFPSGLKFYLEGNKREILKGADSVKERDFSSLSEVRRFVCKEKRKIAEMIKNRKKPKKIAFELGRMFKAIAILSYPFSFDTSFYSRDYQSYAEYKLQKFVFAFNRVKLKDFRERECKILVKSIQKEASELKKMILEDYKIYENSSNFDDLSAAFGAGSLLFSKSCFAMSFLAVDIWLNVNGSPEGALIIK